MLLVFLCLLATLVCSMSLGLACLNVISRKFKFDVPQHFQCAIAFHIIPIFGYCIYWIRHLLPMIGYCLSIFFVLFSLYFFVIKVILSFKKFKTNNSETLIQSAFVVAFAFFFICISALTPIRGDLSYLNKQADPIRLSGLFNFAPGSSYDTLIQYHYLQDIKESPFNKTLCPYLTTVSDRPPVLAGSALLFSVFKMNTVPIYWYTGAMLFFCSSWVFVFWAFFRSMGASYRKSFILLSITGFVPCIFFNTLYFWPRNISASYMLLFFLIFDPLFKEQFIGLNTKIEKRCCNLLGGILAGFSLLSHLVNAFFYVVWACSLLIRNKFRIKDQAIILSIAAAVCLSWYIPKVITESSHPSMVRYLLSDRNNKEIFFDKKISDLTAIYQTYKDRSIQNIASEKVSTLMTPIKDFFSMNIPKASIFDHPVAAGSGILLHLYILLLIPLLLRSKSISTLHLKTSALLLFLVFFSNTLFCILSYRLFSASLLPQGISLMLALLLSMPLLYLREKMLYFILIMSTVFCLWTIGSFYLQLAIIVMIITTIICYFQNDIFTEQPNN